MKTIFTFFFLITILFLAAQTYNSPESVEFDANHQRYIVANTGGNNLQQVIPGSAPTLFVSGVPSPYGIVIVGDTVFVCAQSGYIKSYNLSTASLVGNVNLGASFLNGICADKSGNIFASDFSGKKIYRYNIASQQFNVFTTTTLTPNGILFDEIHNRLVFVTWGSNAPIQAISLTDSTVTTLKTTSLTQCDGVAIDEDGNYFVSSWITGGKGIYFFDSAFANNQLQVVSGLNNPADIFYNIINDTLAVPCTGTPYSVKFYGFPRPTPVADFDTVTVSYSQTICVLQNDLISGNVPLMLQSFSSPQLGTANASGNCIFYTAINTGNDTISYTVCSADTPSFCKTGTLIVTNVISNETRVPAYKSLSLSNIHLFPNPANNILTIDMQNNQEEITRNYAAIEIFNALGEKQKTIPRKDAVKVVSLNVSDLANGIYLAIILSDKNERKTLGRFTIER